MPVPSKVIPFLLLGLASLLAACAPADPKEGILEERMRWDVTVLNWAQDTEGSINISTRVSGPTNSALGHLTVRVAFLDAGDHHIGDYWHTYDLAQVPRGGPADLYIRIPRQSATIVGLALDMVLEPAPDDEARIVELQP